jgi:hypothetical protein
MKTRQYTYDALRASGVALLALCLTAGAVPVRAHALLAVPGVVDAVVAAGGRVVVHAEGQGSPWLSFGDGTTVRATYSGFDKTGSGFGEARALATGDFNNDGVADLIATYGADNGGFAVLHSGNVDAIYPNSPEARERVAAGTYTDSAFLSEARVFQTPVTPDFVGAGDFDADGSLDLVAAQRGGDSIYFLRGSGGGDFEAAKAVHLPGSVSALATGESLLGSGVGAVAVAVAAADGAKVLVFGGPEGALGTESIARPLPSAASDLVFARLDDDARLDVAVAAGRTLVVVNGEGLVTSRDFEAPISTLSAGHFTAADRSSLALLFSDGTVSVMNAARAGGIEKVGAWSVVRTATNVGSASRLSGASLSAGGADDLVVLDKAARSVRIVSQGREASFAVDGEPVAVTSMRLNGDSMRDLVVLASGQTAPVTITSKLRVNIPVTTAADSGAGSLRDAITASNASVGVADVITFAIGTGPQTIALLSPLPAITDAVTIDGTTQPGFAGVPLIDLNGAGAGVSANGLSVTAGGTTIRSLVIRNFSGDGIAFGGNGNSNVEGCFIGTNAAGTTDNGNGGFGVAIVNSANNTVGGTVAAARNVISGNANGVGIAQASATGNDVIGNFIGTSASGAADIGNSNDGVVVSAASTNNIGGTAAGSRNVISGNDANGVQVVGAAATTNAVLGNLIGTDVSGGVPIANANNGVLLTGVAGNTVGSTSAAGRNIISGNGNAGAPSGSGNAGIRLFGSDTNTVVGNYVGLDVTGTIAVPNIGDGVLLIGDSNANTVGGTTTGARNVVSGNSVNGVEIATALATANVVTGNFIGTDNSGLADVGNVGDGVLILNAGGNTIGGTAAGSGNLVSGNNQTGVSIVATAALTANANIIRGNVIGLDLVGTALGNAGDGVRTSGGANDNLIGGTVAGSLNRIASNGGDGVAIVGGTGNAINGNAITGNAGLGIDLGTSGVTPNDVLDPDTGPNNLQNFPVLTSATTTAAGTAVVGTLNSLAATQYRIEFFANTTCDTSGNGEGALFVGTTNVTTDAAGDAAINFTITPGLGPNAIVTATAMSPTGDTSEFSACASTSTLPLANLLVTVTDAPDPVRSGEQVTYTITVTNLGPEIANAVVLDAPTPTGTTFASATSSQGVFTAPAPGAAGTVSFALGAIASGANATATVVLNVTAAAGTVLSFSAVATTASSDPDTTNNTGTATTTVSAAIVPPNITNVQFLQDPFRVRITGSNFQPGVVVFIGNSATPWPNVKYKDSTQVTLKKGADLRALFPRGVPTDVRVVNLDGGEDTFTVTR